MVENWSINREDYEERSETARVVSQTAADVWPSESSWGLFSYGDAPGGIGGGCGCFCWFDNKSKLLQFVETHLVFLNPGPVSMDPAEVAEAVRAAIERIRAGTLDMESGRVEANIQLRSFSQIEWWGKFSELLHEDTEFAVLVRQWFRGSEGQDAAAPVPPEDEDQFVEEIRSYGI